jgi:purine-nucleoside phosphorylase
MMEYMERIRIAADTARAVCGQAEVGVILGSGLGDYAGSLVNARVLPYKDIPGFPRATVPGHAGMLTSGLLNGRRALMMRGRFHGYEGHSMEDVVLPVRVMALLGVRTLIVTNAAGGVNTSFRPGDLMLISDFINLSGLNPLRGPNLDAFGPRFPDMSAAFDPALRALALETAGTLGIRLVQGLYCMMNGPCYETPAEIRMARVLGADAVGMSTVPEVIAARHSGLKVLGISCITNMAAGVLDKPICHEEVMETGERVKETFKALLDGIVKGL